MTITAMQAATIPARANMGNPQILTADQTGEVFGNLKTVAIERETLTIDLRPLARYNSPAAKDDEGSKLAVVEAFYRVRNDGEQQQLNLIFAADALVATPQTGNGEWVDNQSVEFRNIAVDEKALPQSWRAPASTPKIEGDGQLSYRPKPQTFISFKAELAPGPHTIRVRHQTRPASYSG
ncbi:MAG TPA: hypothetical protein VNN73_20385 [Blastocatellia bacterium]|nr:hypothetical protein [Blastocatellia bacterium]